MLLLAVSFIASVFVPIPKQELSPLPVVSLRITDRNDETLREVLSDQEGRAYWLRPDEIPPQLINATIAAEDKYFHFHPGINPLAIARALFQDVTAMRLVSGGSTITQQVIRNIYHEKRSVFGKIVEAWLALRLERTISKSEILVQYLNRVPYGNGTYGAEAASRLYFRKPVSHLSIAEAAFLAAMPNSPTGSNPYKAFHRAKRRQQFILKKMEEERLITEEQYKRAANEPIMLQDPGRGFKAPHFTDMILNSIPPGERSRISVIKTTLDYNIQKAVEVLLKGHISMLKKLHVTNGAVVVIDNATSDVIALAGSVDYFDSLRDGQFDGAIARRQPGSALKPFVYGLALESGMTAADIIPDIPFAAPTRTGSFIPQNYDKTFHGPVRLRTALACSYNVPAVRVAQAVGVDAVLARLRECGLASLDQSASHYGLGVVLGDGEVTLLELTRAYSMLARGGIFLPDRTILSYRDIAGNSHEFVSADSSEFGGSPRTVYSPQVAYILANILSDEDARAPAFGFNSPISLPFPCAVKTGTSKDYKDNWTVGFTPRWTVGVWAGNFDATPMRTVSGVTGAGPIFRDVMLYLEQNGRWLRFQQPDGIVTTKVCTRSGRLPTKDCPGTMDEIFIAGTEPTEKCDMHRVYRIDDRTGTLANVSTPKEYIETKLVETLPPIFDAWLDRQKPNDGRRVSRDGNGIPGKPSGEESRRSMTSAEFGIASPENGSVYKIDPSLRRQFQMLEVAVVAGPIYQNVRLFIDGKLYSNLSEAKVARWALSPGIHEFRLSGEKEGRRTKSAPVRIMVY